MAKIDEIAKEARRLEEDVLHSEKAHFAMATWWGRAHYILGIPAAVSAAAAGISVVKDSPGWSIAFSIASTILTALMTFLDTEKARSDHFLSGTRYNALRGKLRRFYNIDLASGEMTADARAAIHQLAMEKAAIQETARHTGGLPYWLAKRSLGEKQHVYQVDTDGEAR